MRAGKVKCLALVAVALVAAACDWGGSQGDPEAQRSFETALDSLAGYEGIELVFTLESTPEDLARLDEAEETLGREGAEMILNSSLTVVSNDVGPEDAQVEIVANIDGNEDAVEVRMVDGHLFMRAEARELFETFDGDQSRLNAAAEFGAEVSLDFIAPAIEGEWLGVANIDQLVEQFGAGPSASPAATGNVGERLAAILRDASVSSNGSDEVGNHLSVRIPFRESVKDFVALLRQLGGPTGALPLPDTSGLGEGDLTVDAWVDDGRLVQLEVDLLEIGELVNEKPPAGVERFAIRMRIEEFTSDVKQPKSALMIGATEIFGLLLRGSGTSPIF